MKRVTFLAVAVLVFALAARSDTSTGVHAPASGGWSVALTGRVDGRNTQLEALACPSSDDCLVGGEADNEALIEHLAGGKWRVLQGPGVGPKVDGSIDSFACLSSDDCWAVGSILSVATSGLLEHDDGHGWKVTPEPTAVRTWNAVSCPTRTNECWIVGSRRDGKPAAALYRAGVWRSVALPVTYRSKPIDLRSIACAGQDSCVAVGGAGNAYVDNYPVSEVWNGLRWALRPVHGPLHTVVNTLESVSCNTRETQFVCIAVGVAISSLQPPPGSVGVDLPLIERYISGTWTAMSSPHGVIGDYPELAGVSCIRDSSCWAVGSRGPGQDEASTLAEHWNGRAWQWATTPDPPGEYRTLDAVACPTKERCWAAGIVAEPRSAQIILRWRS